MDEPDDATLVERAKAGDVRAFESLVRRHQASVARLAGFVSGSFEAADDIAQETFVKAHRSLHRFTLGRPFRPWVLRIAANTAKNHRRSSGRKARLAVKVGALSIEPHRDPAEEATDRATVRAALERLPASDRLVIALRYFDDLSERDMSEVLGVRTGTVKSRLARSMARLRSELGETDA